MDEHLKTCFKCKGDFPRSAFYAHPETLDGLLGKCKACTLADVAANRAKRLGLPIDYPRKRLAVGPAPAEKTRLYRAKNPEKNIAHQRLQDAVRAGRIARQPCCRCGALRSHAHHESYARPLDVVWYCPKHHSERHLEMKNQGITA